MLVSVLSGFGLAIAAPWLTRLARRPIGWLLALLPVALAIYLASFTGQIAAGGVIMTSTPWVPSLGIDLAFRLDGLSLIMALLVTGIGALVVIYAGSYLADDPYLGRFYTSLLAFMAAMLGVALSDNIFVLFIFWELTSVTSYLLIGHKHDYRDSRDAALQALLVTGSGGLALLAGLVMLGQIGGTYSISGLLEQGEAIRAHGLYLPALILILLGAFTKSAQFPFHFWLPGAMAAPTPVSAYLHSATMVKAGVFLLARLSPALGGTDAWLIAVTGIGAATMVIGAIIAAHQSDVKRILAYTTVSGLGTLTMLLGLGGKEAVKAAMLFLVTHALYKGALFMVGGSLDHETGTRDVTKLGGLARVMPITAVAAGAAGFSMVGLPPAVGFLAKEYVYEATLFGTPFSEGLAYTLAGLALLANALTVLAAGLVVVMPFFGKRLETPKKPHEAPPGMWLGPLVLAGLGLAAGLLPGLLSRGFLTPGTSATLGQVVDATIKYPTGLNPMLILSVVTVALGVGGYAARAPLRRALARLDPGKAAGPERAYRLSLRALFGSAEGLTGLLQSGYLRVYLAVIIASAVGLISFVLLSQSDLGEVVWTSDVRVHEAILAGLILAATAFVVTASSRLAAVVALGVVGFGVALLFMLFGAPDLAMTQFSVEMLTVILFVLVIYRLPRFAKLSSGGQRVRDGAIALGTGMLMTVLVLLVTATPLESRVSPYFAEASVPLAQGRNIVNVILVDFRSLDTLGEITVLAVAALGVYALLKLRMEGGKRVYGKAERTQRAAVGDGTKERDAERRARRRPEAEPRRADR